MVFLAELNFKLPWTNPVLVFSSILFIILFAPLLLNKIRIPHLIGLIIAGALIGPNGFNLLLRDSSVVLFGTVGLLYIMFLAGLEINLADFKKNSSKSIVFGMYTFVIPMVLGTLSGLYILGFGMATSVLLASMFASHTLIAYPIISKLGITKNKAVNITVGGTMITDTLALLVLAVVVGMSTGEMTGDFWLRLFISLLIFASIVVFVFPMLARWFFKRSDDNISQYIFVLALVFLGAFLAEAAGIEGIIGAFLAGLALNKLVPHTSPLMNRIEFVGNALFIPFFLIGVGMLIDFRVFISDFETVKVAIVMTLVATLAKFLAAYFTQKTFNFSVAQRNVIFGLSNAQAAATLAAVLVGYKVIIGENPDGTPIRLLGDSILNGTILMILVTCTIASFVAQRGGAILALEEEKQSAEEKDADKLEDKILIPVNYPENIEELVNFGVTIKSKSTKNSLLALNIIPSDVTDETKEKHAKKLMEKATKAAAATDNILTELIRYDSNLINGISNAAKENKATDIILGLHKQHSISDSILGNLTEGILSKIQVTAFIYQSIQPLDTIGKYVILIPKNAEKELGFVHWLLRVWNIGRNTGAKLVFFAHRDVLEYLREVQKKFSIEAQFNEFPDWEDFLILSREVKDNDALMVIMSRKNGESFNPVMQKLPKYLRKYFSKNNFILVYPPQVDFEDPYAKTGGTSFLNPLLSGSVQTLDHFTEAIGKIFNRK
jgi:Kef-type K+ transport system membrane component KefB